jgi:hypothetical protein
VGKSLAQARPKVVEVSWPLFAGHFVKHSGQTMRRDSLLILGVMNIHCGSLYFSRSS